MSGFFPPRVVRRLSGSVAKVLTEVVSNASPFGCGLVCRQAYPWLPGNRGCSGSNGLPYVDFHLEPAIGHVRRLRPDVE